MQLVMEMAWRRQKPELCEIGTVHCYHKQGIWLRIMGEELVQDSAEASLGKEPSLMKFSEADTNVNYLTGFERIITAYKWPKEMWTLCLMPMLTGESYTNMDHAQVGDHDQVKAAIQQ